SASIPPTTSTATTIATIVPGVDAAAQLDRDVEPAVAASAHSPVAAGGGGGAARADRSWPQNLHVAHDSSARKPHPPQVRLTRHHGCASSGVERASAEPG